MSKNSSVKKPDKIEKQFPDTKFPPRKPKGGKKGR
jgi:hypothetical protein